MEKVVREVIQVLREKGLLEVPPSESFGSGPPPREDPSPAARSRVSQEVQVTIGTAGKVFSGEAGAWKPFPPPQQAGTENRSIAHLIDHTLLKPDASFKEIEQLCREAGTYHFYSVCVNPCHVAPAVQFLKGSPVKICSVIGFPFGATTSAVKAFEAREAIANGADEIDMVLNIGALKSGNDQVVSDDIQAVRTATSGKVLKVILETSLLNDEEKVRACRIAQQAGSDFVKTSTGFSSGGATVEDVRLMRKTVGPRLGIKASGAIKNFRVARRLLEAGATRIGSSSSVAIAAHPIFE